MVLTGALYSSDLTLSHFAVNAKALSLAAKGKGISINLGSAIGRSALRVGGCSRFRSASGQWVYGLDWRLALQ
jgi:hypothetical protein